MSKPKVFLLHNEVSPYRLPLFEALSDEVDLTVYFCETKSSHRKWENNLDDYDFTGIVGKGFNLGPAILNYDLWSLLAQDDYDLFLAGGLGVKTAFAGLTVYLASRLKNKLFVFWTGYVDTEYYRANKPVKRRFGSWWRRFLAKHSSAVISYSKMNEEYLTKLGVPDSKIFRGGQVMPESLLPDSNGGYDEDKGEDELVILTVGYFKQSKGLDYLIEGYKELPDRLRESSELVIAGAGAEEEKLKRLAGDEEGIKFPGYISGVDKSEWYEKADLFVLPSLHDPWGLVINEAMAYGLPIITTEAAGAKEMVSDNGLIVPPGDPEALTGALKDLLEDRERRQRMGKRSREIIEGFSVDSAVETFKETIHYSLGANENSL